MQAHYSPGAAQVTAWMYTDFGSKKDVKIAENNKKCCKKRCKMQYALYIEKVLDFNVPHRLAWGAAQVTI